MTANLVATASILITASREKVWDALINPDAIKQYMFGTTVTTNWREGGPISWKGEWEGKAYEDKGTVLVVEPEFALHYTHYSPLSGPDIPENHHTVSIDLTAEGDRTGVTLTQDNNATEEAKAHSEENWKRMLEGLKNYVESGH
ncbi:MAG: hypothetical protein K0Q91_1699 [Fibrobacteria bacterium]|jgi:uncharacterized protein YndB with AHSA1/START domain|nr:hypothetical protein [Fibrobacteria bacterium]